MSIPRLPAPRRRAWVRLLFAALGFAAAGAAPAQTLVGLPKPVPIAFPKYYVAKDLGPIAEYAPAGCIAPNGMIGLNRRRAEDGWGTHTRPVRYTGSASDYLLLSSPGSDSTVSGCNSMSELVGNQPNGVVWDQDWAGSQMLVGSSSGPAEPRALNDARQVVGRVWGDEPYSFYFATIWTTSQVPYDNRVTQRTLFPGEATAINNAGQVAATYAYPQQPTYAALVENNGAAVTWVPATGVSSWASGIDAFGRVVGAQRDAAGAVTGFVWHRAEGFVALGATSDSGRWLQNAEARAIGADRMVGGRSFNLVNGGVATSRATVWPQTGWPRNLNYQAALADGSALTLTLTAVVGFADSGAVLCEARTADNVRHAVLLTLRPGGRWQ